MTSVVVSIVYPVDEESSLAEVQKAKISNTHLKFSEFAKKLGEQFTRVNVISTSVLQHCALNNEPMTTCFRYSIYSIFSHS